ncbi:HDIG domain-containing protein [Prevotella copri]|jgi:putative nucleotidyltransferase with HDIG domain|uniref:HD family phosphohydrolase n=1 Tax=Segatella copri TaxID=165179 RepID=UPI001C3847F6|nr:HDIG domain-containing metalloprotein [Segatella copri]MBD9260928.1 HDIG domain-containing protein [Prevotella sp.]MBV3415425.1 HDIG domain-containing protein [Segatella copri]
MSIFNNTEENYWRNLATKTVLVCITVAIIVWFLPRNEGRMYRYDVGKPWMYGSVIAKFDFPIYKTDEAIKHEQDSLLKHFQPYYSLNPLIEKKQVERFLHDYEQGINGLPKEYVGIVARQMQEIYQMGIINTNEYNNIFKDSTSMIRFVSGKNAKSLKVSSFYSTIAAYEHIFANEKLAAQRAILSRCNLNNYIEANIVYDKEKSDAEKNDLLSSIPLASGMVMSGQKIIDRGEIVNDYTCRVLNSFDKEMKRRSSTQDEIMTTFIGQILFVLILVMMFTSYLTLFRKDYFEKPRSITMLYTMITLFPILVSMMMKHNFFSVYIIPFAMAAIFVRVFMDSRTAFITHVTMILICAAAVKYQYEFIIVQLASGLVAIYSLRELSKRSQIFITAILVTISSCIVYLALQLMQDNQVFNIDPSMYTYFIINGIFLLLSYPMMYLIEKMFGFISNVTLFELSNTNKGLLRNLSEIAPGTFQHSITVGNLAAEIANRIHANSLLVRTGALYHDIGKMTNPVFFTENQAGVNPHDQLSDLESAQIIISHVTEGLKLAEKFNLPGIIKDFISTHHGNGLTKFFYINYCNEHPDEKVDKEQFQYPGPNPFTREQAILMMADTVEAASRSLKEYTEESISALTNKLIDSQVAGGFFRECPITFRDIALAKSVLIERLKSIYHTRISYPHLNK